jgi:hypothetical protein
VGPAEFSGKGTVVSATFQRSSGSGTLTIFVENGESPDGSPAGAGGRAVFEVEAGADGAAVWPKR